MAKIITVSIPTKVHSSPSISEAWPTSAHGGGPASTHKGWPTSTKAGGSAMPKTSTKVPGQPHLRQAPIGGGKTGVFHASTGTHIGTIHHNPVTKSVKTVSHVTGTSVKGKSFGFVSKSAGFGKAPKIK